MITTPHKPVPYLNPAFDPNPPCQVPIQRNAPDQPPPPKLSPAPKPAPALNPPAPKQPPRPKSVPTPELALALSPTALAPKPAPASNPAPRSNSPSAPDPAPAPKQPPQPKSAPAPELTSASNSAPRSNSASGPKSAPAPTTAPGPNPAPSPIPPKQPPPTSATSPRSAPRPTKGAGNPAHALGRRGENLVAKYVETRGLIVLCRNWHCREGEIDILATDGHMLVVCEVKTRTTDEFGTPADAMTDKKIKRIRAATNRWLREYHIPYVRVRYDLAEVWWPPKGKPHLQYRRDAF